MTRSRPLPPDRAIAAGAGTGVTAAPPDVTAAAAEAVRRELSRLTTLLRRHFRAGDEDSLLRALTNTSDPATAASARAFLKQIRELADVLQRDADNWPESLPATAALADFRRETMALLNGVEDRLGRGDSYRRMLVVRSDEEAQRSSG